MALSTYAELQAAVADWLDRDDLTSQIADFITLAEAEFNRTLIVPEREDAVTSDLSAETLALPSDFYQIRSLYLNSDPKVLLEQITLSEMRTRYSANATGQPQNFVIQGGDTLVVGPSPDATYEVVMNYYADIPALSASNTTNWLLTSHPDIYLFGTLLQAAMFMVDDGRVGQWQAKHDRAVDQLLQAGVAKAFGSAPLRIRSPYNV